MICEVHFPGDVVAGQAFGMMIAERLMEQPSVQVQFNAAAMEMKAAGLS
jgi:acid phosphatase (class A)